MTAHLNWAFSLEYNKDHTSLTVKFSPKYKNDQQLPYSELTFSQDDIAEFIHRYDYRKLDYFIQVKIDHVFDTLMRFNFKKGKYPLRTLAVCHINAEGLTCVNFEEIDMIELKNEYQKQQNNDPRCRFEIENASDIIIDDRKLKKELHQHIAYMTYRDLNVI